jgi:NAD(P)H-hydrate epimerase
MKILTAKQMGEVDRLSSERFLIPSLLLMENAGRSVVDEIERSVPRFRAGRTLIICGRGNNGGDGLVVARHLVMRGAAPEVLLLADPGRFKGDALANWRIGNEIGLTVHVLPDPSQALAHVRQAGHIDIVVDALFGTGLSQPIAPDLGQVVEWVNKSGAFVVAVDIPSGLQADSPTVSGPAIKAAVTVTFTALKLALVVPPASDLAGRVVVAPIGSPGILLDSPDHKLVQTDITIVRRCLQRRRRDAHKGDFGHVFVAAGSRGKSGAAIMTGLAALRSGAGLVTVWLPESLQRDVVGRVPELMTESLPETAEGSIAASGADRLLSVLERADVLVAGPGLTTAVDTVEFVRNLVRRSPLPVVLDADGLNAFASQPGYMRNENGQPVVITPHPGEMARLVDSSITDIQRDRLEVAARFAREHGCFTVLKGFQTVTATPTGFMFINGTGNPGMATGGSGDILSGIMGRFVAGWRRGPHHADLNSLGEYVSSAVYVHGLAGDVAADEQGMESLIATDLLPFLPAALKRIARA